MPHALQVNLRRLDPGRPPAVLLGGLNLVRALGLAGIPAIVASPNADSLAFASRYCTGRCPMPPLQHTLAAAETLAHAGEQLAAALGRPVPLFFGSDDGLNLIQRHRELLAPRFSMVLNEPEVAQSLLDKERFAAFARRHALPTPRALDWASVAGWGEALLVKPKLKVDWANSPVHLRLFGRAGKARVFASGRELSLDPLARQLKDDLVIQEYVPGDDRHLWSFHGYADRQGRLLAWFVGRKLRTYPALTGISTYVELAHDEPFAAVAAQLAARAQLKGVFKMDFKKHAHSGEWRLLEVNARCNLWHYLAARNGVNLMKVAYDYLVNDVQPSAPVRYRTRHRWLSLRADYRAYRSLAARGGLSAAGWLASLPGPKVYDVLSWSDPLPFLVACLQRLRRVPRLTGRLRRWLSTAS